MRDLLAPLLLLSCSAPDSAAPADTGAPPAPWTGALDTLRAGYGGYPVSCEGSATLQGTPTTLEACPDCSYVFEVVAVGETCGVLPDPWFLGVDLTDPSRILQGGEALDHPSLSARWDEETDRLDFGGDAGNPSYPWPNSYSYTSEFGVEGWIILPE